METVLVSLGLGVEGVLSDLWKLIMAFSLQQTLL